jgi:dihydrofolate reductase/thymidylate synthase
MTDTRTDVAIICAMDSKRGIGYKGAIPWNLKKDMSYFSHVTQNSAVVMGRKTWETIGKPLPNRLNVVISGSHEKLNANTIQFGSLDSAIDFLADRKIFIIGGESVYTQALKYAKYIYVTKVKGEFTTDTFMPFFENDFEIDNEYTKPVHEEDGIYFQFLRYVRKDQHPEIQYLNLIRDILSNGIPRPDRTGTGTISVFGRQLRFDLAKGFPLITTKKTFIKGIIHELLWFLKGSVDNNLLVEKGVHIWDGNSTRKYLDAHHLDYREGELGPIYGFQWRHFGAKYRGIEGENRDANIYSDWARYPETYKIDYTGEGRDQIKDVIHSIRTDPYGRRHIISAWNPVDIPKMAIPPCHVMCQFYVAGGRLSCQLYQRSGDVGLGVPFNIASYALLTHLIAKCCDLLPGEFIHTFGDAHIYNNHIDALKLQITRDPKPFPRLKINTDTKDIFAIKYEDIEIVGYESWPAIKMDLSV